MYRFKTAFQFLLRPVARWVHSTGATANVVTLFAMVGSLAVAGLLLTVALDSPRVWLVLPVWCLVRMAANAIDGVLAREYGHQSRFGAAFNELADVVSDAALFLPLTTLPTFDTWWVFGVILLASWTEFAGLLGPTLGATRRYDGPMGKADRALVLGLIGAWVGLTSTAPPGATWIEGGMVVLLLITILNRVGYGLAEAGGPR